MGGFMDHPQKWHTFFGSHTVGCMQKRLGNAVQQYFQKRGEKELNEQLAISVKVEIIYFGSVSHSIECGFEGWSILWYGFGGWVFFLSTEIFNEKFSLFRTW